MNPTKYYDKTASFKKRSLTDGTLDERNAHNFIKSVIIKDYVKKDSVVLDLGCGKGGDVLKFKFSNIKCYTGVDVSQKSLIVCEQRLQKMGFHYKLFNSDMWEERGFGNECYDVVSSQFSLHYSFDCEETANKTLENVYNSLKKGGYFIGTIPISETSYEKTKVTIPGHDDVFLEPTVSLPTFMIKLEQHKFKIVKLENFKTFYENASKTNKELLEKMKANLFPPKENYHVFVLIK
tara:strand:+ start:111 stop:818 length:708 start_codon:yes stop_codon:yes gene_type:complete